MTNRKEKPLQRQPAGFGERLRFVRKKRGEDQITLSKRADIGITTLRRAEADKFDPRMGTARKLADALQVRLEWLLTGEEPLARVNQMTFEEQLKMRPPACPSCQGRGFTWDYDDYDGFYAICSYCDGPEHFVIVEPGPWFLDDAGVWQYENPATKERS